MLENQASLLKNWWLQNDTGVEFEDSCIIL